MTSPRNSRFVVFGLTMQGDNYERRVDTGLDQDADGKWHELWYMNVVRHGLRIHCVCVPCLML
jgi:hypothetical protein